MALSSQDKPKQSLNSRIAYALTDRKILHFRYDAHLRQQVMKQLSKTQRELLNRLAAAGVDALPKKQLDTLLKELKQEVAKVYQEMTAYTQDELSGFFAAETQHIHQLYNDEVGFDFFNRVPEYKQKANKTATIIAGSPLEDWWAKQGNDFAFKFEGIIRQGLLDGQQTSQMITDVKHLMNTSRRHAETLVITAVAKVADKAHQALRDENLDILAGEKHLSTLDTRTSTVCQLRDGLMWDLDKKPIDHDVPYQRPPLHPRCRSILQLVTKSWKELGIDAEEMPSSTRASQDGPVSEQINYENWLKSKSPGQQDQVLGKGKADLWRRGVITFADMLDQSGRPLTLKDLSYRFDPNYIYPEVDTFVLKGTKFTRKQLDRKFKHIEDFGFDNTKKNPKMLKRYQESIIEHLNDVETIEFGRYRLEGSRVFYNKITGMAVVIDKDGNFVTAFIPKDEPDMNRFQLSNYLKSGYLR
ncbi:minor capsid protein [Glaesserella parasuis]|nr:minor capsid protein [Glaesserella parasuis]MCT8706669.1 minor capsid protein [Glaesserella parasuis]MCT8709103.1 minor capsid protein [Glaesserella parasuis]MCT8710372.1 minor capsid protein [Glaesserella parasuis]MCT8713656.1 minor capsid protein [Glaesserella parasuis]